MRDSLVQNFGMTFPRSTHLDFGTDSFVYLQDSVPLVYFGRIKKDDRQTHKFGTDVELLQETSPKDMHQLI